MKSWKSFKKFTKGHPMQPLKIITGSIFATTLLFANCSDSIPLSEFLKETSKYEETINMQKSKIKLLEKEKVALKKQLKELKSKPNITQTSKKPKQSQYKGLYKVVWNEANIYINNAQDSFSPYSLVKDERITIEKCDKFGWCKIKDKKLYIKKHTIQKAN